ncbi:MAG: SCP2 sterol-binding domain-containing protein [Candidatus Helarchaeota archaeon]
MIQQKEVACKVIMGALFYTLEEVTRVNKDFIEKIKDIDARIQWNITGGPTAYLLIEKGKVSSEFDKSLENPNLNINIVDVDSALGLFTGKISMETSPEKISIKPKEKAEQLLFILDYLRSYFETVKIREEGEDTPPKEDNELKKKIAMKTLLYMILSAHEEISKIDEDFEEELIDFEEAVIQWEIGDDIFGYFKTEDGQVTFKIDEKEENPTIQITIPKIDDAIAIFTGRIPGMKAYMKKLLDVQGDLNYIQKMAMASQTVQEYLKILL